jgi:epoxyqueuosine reductase QueG
LVQKSDLISFDLAAELEKKGIMAIPIPSADPYDYWDSERNHGRGILSLKHAGSLAGLGVIGKNTLLVNDRYGNMVWLGAILASVDLAPDPIAQYKTCPKKCKVCIDLCPQSALDGTTINQKLCRERSTSSTAGGGWILSCNTCRKVCPNHAGIKAGNS